ncbi:hypothetical protein BDC45DRAFT_496463 [Circinella umbellata]|nr:hypothetical protein BDC45DRAFT_496463 [Circinella umbellata]
MLVRASARIQEKRLSSSQPENQDKRHQNSMEPLSSPSISIHDMLATILNRTKNIDERIATLLDRTEIIDETVATILRTQQLQEQALHKIEQTLGISSSSEIMTVSNDENNNSDSNNLQSINITKIKGTVTHKKEKKQTSKQHSNSTSVASSNKRTTMATRPTQQHQRQSQHRVKKSKQSSKSCYSSGRVGAKGLPGLFVQHPRKKNGINIRSASKSDFIKAIRSLSKSEKTQEELLAFMEDTMEAAIKKVKSKATFKQGVQSWTYQDADVVDGVIKWVIKKGTNHSPSIPLGECEGNWLARVWLTRKWYAEAEKEKKARTITQRSRVKQQQEESTPEYMDVDDQESLSSSDDNEIEKDNDNNSHPQQIIPRLRTPIVIPAEEQSNAAILNDQPEDNIAGNPNHISFERRTEEKANSESTSPQSDTVYFNASSENATCS